MALPKEMEAVKSKEANLPPLLIVDTPGKPVVIYVDNLNDYAGFADCEFIVIRPLGLKKYGAKWPVKHKYSKLFRVCTASRGS